MLWPKLPSPDSLGPWLRKLDHDPAGCIILTIEAPPPGSEQPPVKIGWLSAEERKKIRKLMVELSIQRAQRNEAHFTDPEH